jgi:hypothetical protein
VAERLVLHVGLMKSGTTFIQGRCNANRELFAQQGILFPGPTWARHAQAVSDLIESKHAKPGSWAGLREEINAHPGTAIVSMEYLGPIRAPRIAQLASDFPDTDLQVVVTVRDLGRTVPAMWQETVKNRATWGWADYLRSIEKGGDAGKRFWRQHSAAQVVQRWAEVVGTDHVTVITVPPPGAPSELLWDRFREVAGIAPAAWVDAPRANESLGVASALLMRRLNEATEDLAMPAYKKRVKALGKHVLVHRKREEDPIGFTVPAWLRKTSVRMNKKLAESGVRVIGDLTELEPVDVPGVDPAGVPVEQELEAAVSALSTVLRDGKPTWARKALKQAQKRAQQRAQA